MSTISVKEVHVDREQEFALFKRMIAGEEPAHILFIQAEAGMGKTSLLSEFWAAAEPPSARLNLKQTNYGVEQILSNLRRQLGPTSFPLYGAAIADAARAPTVNIDHNTLKNVDIEARLDDADRRDRVRQVITDAFFDDLSTFDVGDRRVVVIFDTYEQASAVVQQWLSGMFLELVRNHLRLVLVVAGREIPELDTDAHDWCLRHELMPLDHDNVSEFVRRVELVLSDEEFRIVYEGSGGRPLELATIVERLIRSRRSHG